MKKVRHRLGIGFDPRSPTGLMEHSKFGTRMERAFQNSFINKMFDIFIRASTNNHLLNIARGASGGKLTKFLKKALNLLLSGIDKILFKNIQKAKDAFLGRISGNKYRSVLGGYLWELIKKYIADWTYRQNNKIRVSPPVRKFALLEKTYKGWKRFRDKIQPNWNILPKEPKNIVKILPQDKLTPKERIERLIKGKETDRVGLGLSWNWGVPFMGGSNIWKFCYDGIETAWASVNVWARTGGADFLPIATGIGAYSIPIPDSHSRFFYKWSYPSDNKFPQFIEKELLHSYQDLFDHGMIGLTREITKRMIRDTFITLREIIYLGIVTSHYFGKYNKQFLPYASGLFAVWDILPFWRSMIPFMRDLKEIPEQVIEAFEFLNKPLTDAMIKICKLIDAKIALIGNSRGSNTFVSPEMFEDIFWPSMKYTFERCIENDIIPMCHLDNNWTENMVIFAEKLPKRSCVFHLDQVDLVEVHELIGDHFCLMGGMSPGLLVRGSPKQVENKAKHYIENIKEDGLIISSGCEFPANTPIKNVYALKKAVLKYGYF
ncbi:MAG: hypothetical protein GF329_16305 [Candidatus Lokiarchaeota archaeon]|nr:hypothetical protein [Candidatus Lokiarchaeota archaeon]